MIELAATFYVIERIIEWAIVFAVVVVPVTYYSAHFVVGEVQIWRSCRRLERERQANDR